MERKNNGTESTEKESKMSKVNELVWENAQHIINEAKEVFTTTGKKGAAIRVLKTLVRSFENAELKDVAEEVADLVEDIELARYFSDEIDDFAEEVAALQFEAELDDDDDDGEAEEITFTYDDSEKAAKKAAAVIIDADDHVFAATPDPAVENCWMVMDFTAKVSLVIWLDRVLSNEGMVDHDYACDCEEDGEENWTLTCRDFLDFGGSIPKGADFPEKALY